MNLTQFSFKLLGSFACCAFVTSLESPSLAQATSPQPRLADQVQEKCGEIIARFRLGVPRTSTQDPASRSLTEVPRTSTQDPVPPSVTDVSKAILITKCNWEVIRERSRSKAKQLTARINLLKGLSLATTTLGAGGAIASASGSNTGLTIGSGAVAVIGIFTGIFTTESTVSRRDKCNQLVTLDPSMQTTFAIWDLRLSDDTFRNGFASELQSFNSAIDSGVKGCIAESWAS